MPNHNHRNLRTLLTRGSGAAAEEKLKAEFNQIPPDLAPTALVALSQGLNTNTLGTIVFPAIADRLNKDEKFFDQIAKLATKPGLSQEFYRVLLDFLDSTARKSDALRKTKNFTVLRQVAQQSNLPIEARAKACRLLARDETSPQTRAVVIALAQTGNPPLVAATGHVAQTWARTGVPVPPKLATTLISWANAHPQEAVRFPGVLRGVAELQTPAAEKAIRALIKAMQKPQEQLLILQAIGNKLPDDLFAKVVEKLNKNSPDQIVPIVRSLVSENPHRLEAILDHISPLEFLYWLRNCPEVSESLVFMRRLERLKKSRDIAVSTAAHAATERSPISVKFDAAVQGNFVLNRRFRPAPPDLGLAYSTGFQRADAMYKTLDVAGALINDHWHAGLFNAFEGFANGRGKLSGLHATDDISDTVHWFSAEGVYFNSANGTLEAPMRRLYNEFLTAFGVTNGAPFQGVRTSRNGVSLGLRRNIMNRAVLLRGEGIDYTFADMLDYRRWDWDGSPRDIDEIRCDGVVEYCYEGQWIRVCGGKNPNVRNQWCISLPGTNHPENHNDLHMGNYNSGELCPRIQAGNEGNDTQFVRASRIVPIIRTFTVFSEWMGDTGPWVVMEIGAPFSDSVWGRLRVRPVGSQQFDFLVSEPDVYGRYGGAWRLQAIPPNSTLAIKWSGKIASGPQYGGPGTKDFEFRLQVIDQGGNVSREKKTVASLDLA